MFIKIPVIIATLALIFVTSLQADESTISQIQNKYKTIRKELPTLSKEEIDLSGYSAEGGTATAYHDGKGNTRLIRAELYGESGKFFEEFYYLNGLLFFAFYENHRYNVPYYVTPEITGETEGNYFDPNKTKVLENRYYFNKGKMVRWLNENKSEVNINTKEFKEAETDVTNFSNELLVKFKRKAKH